MKSAGEICGDFLMRPGGYMLCTTSGELYVYYLYLLLDMYARGRNMIFDWTSRSFKGRGNIIRHWYEALGGIRRDM